MTDTLATPEPAELPAGLPAEELDLGPVPMTPDDVPGWLYPSDRLLFDWLLDPAAAGPAEPGDLLEIGAYLGRSAIHIGTHQRPEETFTVCDLFDLAGTEASIRPGARAGYKDLTQGAFERNYLAFHERLPVIVRAHSDLIADRVRRQSCRFVHIDGSHMYEHVHNDLWSAHQVLQTDGIVAFDDYRTEHCLGVAAAIWEAVATGGLKVVCATANKFYATWGNPAPVQDRLIELVAAQKDHRTDVQTIMDQRLVRVARITPKRRPATR